MDIQSIKMQASTPNRDNTELYNVYAECVETYGNVFLIQIDSQQFVTRALGRKDFKDIMANELLNSFQKEEVICETCTLYPKDFDFEKCDAGIPSKLAESILHDSYLDGDQDRRNGLMNYYRQEMVQLHNQINCLISEAFPNYDFEEIENWDMEKTLKFLSRSEWILQNLRSTEMMFDPFTGQPWDASEGPVLQQPQHPVYPVQPTAQKQAEFEFTNNEEELQNSFISGETLEERFERLNSGKIKKKRLTPEELRLYQQKYPEIDWLAQHTVEDFETKIVSSESPALR